MEDCLDQYGLNPMICLIDMFCFNHRRIVSIGSYSTNHVISLYSVQAFEEDDGKEYNFMF